MANNHFLEKPVQKSIPKLNLGILSNQILELIKNRFNLKNLDIDKINNEVIADICNLIDGFGLAIQISFNSLEGRYESNFPMLHFNSSNGKTEESNEEIDNLSSIFTNKIQYLDDMIKYCHDKNNVKIPLKEYKQNLLLADQKIADSLTKFYQNIYLSKKSKFYEIGMQKPAYDFLLSFFDLFELDIECTNSILNDPNRKYNKYVLTSLKSYADILHIILKKDIPTWHINQKKLYEYKNGKTFYGFNSHMAQFTIANSLEILNKIEFDYPHLITILKYFHKLNLGNETISTDLKQWYDAINVK